MAGQNYLVFTPEVWSPRIDEYFKKKLVAGKHFLNFSNEVAQGGDTVHIPKIADSFAGTAIAQTTGAVTKTVLQDTSTTLLINKWYASRMRITNFQLAQVAASYNLKDAYARAMAQDLREIFDRQLLAEASNLSPSVNDTTTTIVATDLQEAIRLTESFYIPKEDLVWFFPPNIYWNQIMLNDKYSDKSKFGESILLEGFQDLLYGIPVVITDQVPLFSATSAKRIGLLVAKNALCYAFCNLPNGVPSGIGLTEIPNAGGEMRTEITADIGYGVKIMNYYHGVKIYASST